MNRPFGLERLCYAPKLKFIMKLEKTLMEKGTKTIKTNSLIPIPTYSNPDNLQQKTINRNKIGIETTHL